MTSRERVLTALRRQEPDRVPFDLGSTQVTTIALGAYCALREHLGLPPVEPEVVDRVQQVVRPDEDLLEHFAVDTRGLFPRLSSNFELDEEDAGEFWNVTDEWGFRYVFPKTDGLYYNLVESPFAGATFDPGLLETHAWPNPRRLERFAGLREEAEAWRAEGRAVVLRSYCAGLVEMAQRARGMENFLVDLLADPEGATRLMRKLLDLKLAYWETALDEVGDVVDVVVEADDYGTQDSQLVPPRVFRQLVKPLLAELIGYLRGRLGDGQFILFHSCGSVRELIPDFIELGIDALNPVHVRAAGMEPAGLKRDFGADIAFWGGLVDTQGVLPNGTPEEVRADVRRNVAALAPGGGYVANAVHNIQADVPPENIVAMVDALRELGAR